MIPAHTAIWASCTLIITAAPVAAQTSATGEGTNYDGLYRPAGQYLAGWSCDAASIGMDGGALAIRDRYFEGVENRCELTTPRPTGDGATAFTALCSAEGEITEEQITLARTLDGILVGRGEFTVEWTICDPGGHQGGAQTPKPQNGP